MKKIIPTLLILVLLLVACSNSTSTSTPEPLPPIDFSGTYTGLISLVRVSDSNKIEGTITLRVSDKNNDAYEAILTDTNGSTIEMSCTSGNQGRTSLNCGGNQITDYSPLTIQFLVLRGNLNDLNYSGESEIRALDGSSDDALKYNGTFNLTKQESTPTPPIVSTPSSNNLLKNPSFEKEGEAWFLCNDKAKDKVDIKIPDGVINLLPDGCAFQTVEATPNRTYTLECTGHSDGISWSSAALIMLDKDFNDLAIEPIVYTSTSFKTLTAQLYAPRNTVHIDVMLLSKSNSVFSECSLQINDVTPTTPTNPTNSCCKVCRTGKACGDSCISKSNTCNKGSGCACNGFEVPEPQLFQLVIDKPEILFCEVDLNNEEACYMPALDQ